MPNNTEICTRQDLYAFDGLIPKVTAQTLDKNLYEKKIFSIPCSSRKGALTVDPTAKPTPGPYSLDFSKAFYV